MGHALDDTLQDILIRFKRMQGYAALWLPGTDHASIATEAKIVEAMKAEGLTKEIEARTGVEARFVRPAHIVRGGIPTLVDRNFASKSGYKAVELLLEGVSDVVICQRNGEIVPVEIKFALILDRMYKGKLKDGDLDKFTKEQIAEMEAICAERRAYFDDIYATINAIGC